MATRVYSRICDGNGGSLISNIDYNMMNFKQVVEEEKIEFSKIFAYEEVKGLTHHEILNFLDQAMTKAAVAVVEEIKYTVINSRTLEETTGVGNRECTARAQAVVDIESLKQQLSEKV